MIDLRSDTVTKPSKAMREIMAQAEVGDDVHGEDPTINALQEYCAELYGKETALYVPSGTMANQTSLSAHTQPGDEIICEYGSHIFNYEGGAPGVLSGVQLHPLYGDHGILTAEQIREAIRTANVHHPVTRVVALENTHNRAGGVVYPVEVIAEISELAREHGLKMHLDGARLMNASVATGIAPIDYVRYFDSVTLCFSKGLGAPVGSIVMGDEEFITKVHRYRKIFGGGMRQAGIIAAGALFAIRNNVDRIRNDHKNARRLAAGLNEIDGISLELDWVQTNIVIFDVDLEVMNAAALCDAMKQREVYMNPIAEQRVRAVTSLMVSDEDIDRAIATFHDVL
ncbi:MAG: L-allo-threonine aldolase [Candidatus Marinimicrobia bacterium]|nr:L-allo-threonine aldolase [Candidatus Neomarinimicrobiota bacterium]